MRSCNAKDIKIRLDMLNRECAHNRVTQLRPDMGICKTSISISIRTIKKILISISIFIRIFLKIVISISKKEFCKILISIKYCIDKDLAYQTPLVHMKIF